MRGRHIGFPCLHTEQVHDKVIEVFTQPETFDPLNLKPGKRTVALAVMVGMIILSLTLGESATPQGIVL